MTIGIIIIYFLYCVIMKFNSILREVIVKISKKMKSQQLQQVYRYLEIYAACWPAVQMHKGLMIVPKASAEGGINWREVTIPLTRAERR